MPCVVLPAHLRRVEVVCPLSAVDKVVLTHLGGNPKIRNFRVAFGTHQHVLRLDVPMCDLQAMQVGEATQHVEEKQLGLSLGDEGLSPRHEVGTPVAVPLHGATLRRILDDHVHLAILVGLVKVSDESNTIRVSDASHNLHLVVDFVKRCADFHAGPVATSHELPLPIQAALVENFHRKLLSGALLLAEFHLPEGATPKYVTDPETVDRFRAVAVLDLAHCEGLDYPAWCLAGLGSSRAPQGSACRLREWCCGRCDRHRVPTWPLFRGTTGSADNWHETHRRLTVELEA
mmetsp:Transcript_172685/g.553461  ORF Transcript_172685/g.553461 Transcript_172685/m.553461 type:complete len:289 (+) Transcript_172685:363-1229(+)